MAEILLGVQCKLKNASQLNPAKLLVETQRGLDLDELKRQAEETVVSAYM